MRDFKLVLLWDVPRLILGFSRTAYHLNNGTYVLSWNVGRQLPTNIPEELRDQVLKFIVMFVTVDIGRSSHVTTSRILLKAL